MTKVEYENLLINDDNLHALTLLKNRFKHKIRCVLIDPPYNTGFKFDHFDDDLPSDVWVEMMRKRLVILRDLLRDDGSIWIHIDDSELYTLKLLCDEIFGKDCFLANVIYNHRINWNQGIRWNGYSGKFKLNHSYILAYSKSKNYEFEGKEVPSTVWKANSVGGLEESFEESAELFGDQDKFSTPKPERLVQYLLNLTTKEGDYVLDCFAGSGTTGAVAHKMNRKWIMIEKGEQAITHVKKRVENIISGKDQIGISKDINWHGGGNFAFFANAHELEKLL